MIGLLLALHAIVTILLILIVLIQKNEGGSSLFANSGGGGIFNARGTSNMLTKITWVLAAFFLGNCVCMAMIASSNIKHAQTLVDEKMRKRLEEQAPLETERDPAVSLKGKVSNSSGEDTPKKQDIQTSQKNKDSDPKKTKDSVSQSQKKKSKEATPQKPKTPATKQKKSSKK
jgi:preprotein translocase subunit SecG